MVLGCWTGDESPLGGRSRPPRPAAFATGARLRVASYNIAGGRLGLPGVVETLRRADADLIGLQEVWRDPRRGAAGDQAAVIARALGMRHAYGAHRLVKVPEEGVALLSRHPLVEIVVVPTPPGRRVLLEAVALTPRGRVTVLVVHLRAVGVAMGARRAQYLIQRQAEARLAAARAAGSRGPLVLLGDLNDTPQSKTLGLLVPPLVDACADLGERTWPSGLPLMRLDHVLVRAPLGRGRCRVLTSASSDHRPVVAEIPW